MTKLTFCEKVLHNQGAKFQFDHIILEATKLSDVIVVLFHPDSFSFQHNQSSNLYGYSVNGEELWVADYPQSGKQDYYYSISEKLPLIARSFSSFECEIEASTGKVLSSVFYK